MKALRKLAGSLGGIKCSLVAVLIWVSLLATIAPQPEAKLLGDHICETEIIEPQEVLKWELKNRTTRTYKWCMNVPPRCSVYYNKVVNESRLAIININKSIETCCEGFKEQNNFCVSQCQNCQNGLCIKESCICQKGWIGPHCDSRPLSITTSNHFLTTSPSSPTSNAKSPSSLSTTAKEDLLDQTLNAYRQYLSTTTEDPILEEYMEGSGSKLKSFRSSSTESSYFDTTVTHMLLSEEKLNSVEDNRYSSGSVKDIFPEDVHYESSTTLEPINTLNEPNIEDDPKTLTKDNLLKNNIDDFIDGKYEKHSSVETSSQDSTLEVESEKSLIYSICAASLITFLVLVAAVTLYSIRNSRKKLETSRDKKAGTVTAVYAASIFHSPLPDLPTFDNPTYLATTANDENGLQDPKEHNPEAKEFNVTFQKAVKNPKPNSRQYFYDYPPSSGSYRASSEVDTLFQYNASQKSGIVLEPLYQEIPSKDFRANSDPYRSEETPKDRNCLYMNTCGRTKF